jgi:hypothetical protein
MIIRRKDDEEVKNNRTGKRKEKIECVDKKTADVLMMIVLGVIGLMIIKGAAKKLAFIKAKTLCLQNCCFE